MPTALIVGAGIGGLAAAIALRREGWDVRIFESAPAPRDVAAQAFEDAVALGRALKHDGDHIAALRHYEDVRSPRTRRVVQMGPRIARITTTRNPVVSFLRDTAIRMVAERAILKAFTPNGDRQATRASRSGRADGRPRGLRDTMIAAGSHCGIQLVSPQTNSVHRAIGRLAMKRVDRHSAGCWRTAVISGVTAFTVLAGVSCNKPPDPRPDVEGGRLKESVETQKTINRYFHDTVMPRLKPCWDRLQGSGSVQMKYVYARTDTQWTMKTVEISESRLPQEQTALATSCMQEAIAGNSLPVDSLPVDKEVAVVNKDLYVVNWTWPVPLPPDAEDQYAQMLKDNGGGGGSGCDGFGASPRCVACTGSGGSGTGTTCTSVCVGGDPPCTITENPNPGGFSRTCTYGSGCSSGGLFGVVGGRTRF